MFRTGPVTWVPALPPRRLPRRPPNAPSSTLIADELRKLADLRAEGILTEQEFTAQKEKLLGQ
jgi:hypothetical protein